MERINIVIDTREQQPYSFDPERFETVRRALPAGDYSLVGSETRVAVECEEAAADLRGAMARGWEIRKMEDRAYGLYRVAREIEDALKAAE